MRVSSLAQEEGYSLQDQEEHCRAHGDTRGYRIHDRHVWNDGAQKSYTLNRPGLNAAIDAIKQGEISVLLVGKYDRLSRVQWQAAIAIHQIEHLYGGLVESANEREQFDRDSTGTLLRNIAAFVAERERESIIERTQGGRKARARDGKIISGPYPTYGYEWLDRGAKRGKSRYVIDEGAAQVVRRIYHATLLGHAVRAIARQLNDEGVLPPAEHHARNGYPIPGRYTGHGKWTATTIYRILTNTIYKGEYVAYRTITSAEHRFDPEQGQSRLYVETKKRPLDDPDRIVNHHAAPAIVNPAIWEQAQEALRQHSVESARHATHARNYLLRGGFAVCGHCGRNLSALTQKPSVRKNGERRKGFSTYTCNGSRSVPGTPLCSAKWLSIGTNILDNAVWLVIEYIFRDPKRIRTILDYQEANLRHKVDLAADRKRSLQEVLEDTTNQLKNAMQAVLRATSDETHAMWAAKVEQLTELRRKYADDLVKMEKTTQDQAMSVDHLADIEQWVGVIGETIGEMSLEERRQLLHALDLHVRVFSHGQTPRYVIEFDISRLRQPLRDLDLFEYTDTDVERIKMELASVNDCDAVGSAYVHAPSGASQQIASAAPTKFRIVFHRTGIGCTCGGCAARSACSM
jgi:DNA invertase Pin-like site-specific DNA recombinase